MASFLNSWPWKLSYFLYNKWYWDLVFNGVKREKNRLKSCQDHFMIPCLKIQECYSALIMLYFHCVQKVVNMASQQVARTFGVSNMRLECHQYRCWYFRYLQDKTGEMRHCPETLFFPVSVRPSLRLLNIMLSPHLLRDHWCQSTETSH